MKILITIILILIFGMAIGGIIEWINSRSDKKKYMPTGKLIEINGNKMNIFTKGDKGNSIVLISGLATHSPYVNFQPLWSRLAEDNRIIVPERFGYGFSDLSKEERTYRNIVQEMNTALKLCGEKPPYTLVGHSMGGSICIAYAQAYPEEVANIVMLDAPIPDVFITEKLPKDIWRYIVPVLRRLGLLRLLALNGKVMQNLRAGSNEYKETPKNLWNMDRSLLLRNFYNANVRNEQSLLQNNMSHVTESKYPYNKPVLFITSLSTYKVLSNFKNVQSDYIKHSIKSKLVELDGQHFIHQYFPNEISKIINDFIN